MRLSKRATSDTGRSEALLAELGHGYLAAVQPDGWPLLRPLNFVYLDGRVYFHGARKGEKMDTLVTGGRVAFVAARDFSVVPSHFVDSQRACPATQYYEAVMIRGRARIVSDPDEKARALQALMEKLQPEGGHVPITAREPLYAASLKSTAVVAIEVEEMTGKLSLGQDRTPTRRKRVIKGLQRRNAPGDAATIDAMRAAAPGKELPDPS